MSPLNDLVKRLLTDVLHVDVHVGLIQGLGDNPRCTLYRFRVEPSGDGIP